MNESPAQLQTACTFTERIPQRHFCVIGTNLRSMMTKSKVLLRQFGPSPTELDSMFSCCFLYSTRCGMSLVQFRQNPGVHHAEWCVWVRLTRVVLVRAGMHRVMNSSKSSNNTRQDGLAPRDERIWLQRSITGSVNATFSVWRATGDSAIWTQLLWFTRVWQNSTQTLSRFSNRSPNSRK